MYLFIYSFLYLFLLNRFIPFEVTADPESIPGIPDAWKMKPYIVYLTNS